MGDDNKPGQEGPQPGQAPQMPQLEGYAVSMAGPGGAPPQVSMAMSQAGLPTLAPAAQHTMHQQPQIHMQVRLVGGTSSKQFKEGKLSLPLYGLWV